MFLSFIVPVYNVEKYVGACLDSLLNQDLPKDDYEIICVDDGSTDGSLQILTDYAERYPNITVRTENNGGVSRARNTGLSLAKGDYVWFVDSDDLIICNGLSAMKQAALKYQVNILDFGAYTFQEKLTDAEAEACRNQTIAPTRFANRSTVCFSLFERAFLENHGITFCEQLAHAEDNLFQAQCAMQDPCIFRMEVTRYLYRRREGSAMTSVTPEALQKKLDSLIPAVTKFYSLYTQSPEKYKPLLADFVVFNLCVIMLELSKMPGKKAAFYLDRLRAVGLFPFTRPAECTLTRSYQTNRTDKIGKLYDRLVLGSYTRTGYRKMRIWSGLYKVYDRVRHCA